MNPNSISDTQRVMPNKRTNARWPSKEECVLITEFVNIKSQTVDVSLLGLGVLVNGTTPFEKEDKLFVRYMQGFSRAQVRWTNKDDNNYTTRLGLELFSQLIYF